MTIIQEIRKKWRPRRPTAHKGDFGRVFILAGSRGLAGAAHLAGMGALRAGAGLVTVGVPDPIYNIAARREAEVMVKPFPSTREGSLGQKALKPIEQFLKTQDVLALGPGLSQNAETQKLVRTLLQRNTLPVVIDADALNALGGRTPLLKNCGQAVLTPHPGEFVRLFGGKLSRADSLRKKRARETAMRFKVTIVLKGHRTVVAAPDGRLYWNPTGNPGMATAGAGDVLTGILAALIGQRFSLWDAARFAVFFHGLAGDLAAKKFGQTSLVAGDLLNFLPAAFKKGIKG